MINKLFHFMISSLMATCLLVPFGIIAGSAVQADTRPDEISEKYVISHVKGQRTASIVDYDATDDYFFLAYSEKLALVDAYSMNGEYAFSIIFDFRRNGSISLRCEDNYLYVYTKYGNVFIFEGERCVEAIEADSASGRGYGWWWFEDKQRSVKLSGLSLIRQDREDNTRIVLPMNVLWGFYSNYLLPTVIIFAILLEIHRSGIFKKTRIAALFRR